MSLSTLFWNCLCFVLLIISSYFGTPIAWSQYGFHIVLTKQDVFIYPVVVWEHMRLSERGLLCEHQHRKDSGVSELPPFLPS